MDFSNICTTCGKTISFTRNNPDICRSFPVTEINYYTINIFWVSAMALFSEKMQTIIVKHHFGICNHMELENLLYENDFRNSGILIHLNAVFIVCKHVFSLIYFPYSLGRITLVFGFFFYLTSLPFNWIYWI